MASEANSPQVDRYKIQEDLYRFPYHHIPHFDNEDVGVRFRILDWGLEYLCYTRHIREIVQSLSPSSVLDVGCGDGRVIGALNLEIGREVYQTYRDLSSKNLGKILN